MTIHSSVHYKCEDCGNYFVPIPIFKNCPKCGHESSKIFYNFIEDTIRSALFNLINYNSFEPYGWAFITIGDSYYWLAFNFLSFASSSLKVAEKDLFGQTILENTANQLALNFLDKIDFGNQEYMIDALRIYFINIICPSEIKHIADKSRLKISCFLSHCTSDKKFCNKLYSDIEASGIGCWYFPENATIGKTVWGEIDKRIKSCNKVIVVCSENSLQSAPVLREIERVLQQEDAEGRNILLPIRIDDYVLKNWDHPRKTDVIAKVIGNFQEWKDKEKYLESLHRLIKAIES